MDISRQDMRENEDRGYIKQRFLTTAALTLDDIELKVVENDEECNLIIEELQRRREQNDAEISRLRTLLSSKQNALEKLSDAFQESLSKRTQVREMVSELIVSHTEACNALNNLMASNYRAEKTLDEKQREIKELDMAQTDITKINHALKLEVKNLEEKLGKFFKSVDAREEDFQRAEKAKADISIEISVKKEKLDFLLEEKAGLCEKRKDVEIEYEVTLKKLKALENEANALAQEPLESAVARQWESDWLEEQEELDKTLSELTSNLAQEVSAMEVIASEVDAAESRYDELKKLYDEIEAQNNRLIDDLDSITQTTMELKSEPNLEGCVKEELTHTIALEKSAIENREKLLSRLSDLYNGNSGLERNINDHSQEILQITKELENLHEYERKLTTEISATEIVKKDQDDKFQVLQAQLFSAESILNQTKEELEQRLNEKNLGLESAKRFRTELEEDYISMKNLISTNRLMEAELAAELKQVEDNHAKLKIADIKLSTSFEEQKNVWNTKKESAVKALVIVDEEIKRFQIELKSLSDDNSTKAEEFTKNSNSDLNLKKHFLSKELDNYQKNYKELELRKQELLECSQKYKMVEDQIATCLKIEDEEEKKLNNMKSTLDDLKEGLEKRILEAEMESMETGFKEELMKHQLKVQQLKEKLIVADDEIINLNEMETTLKGQLQEMATEEERVKNLIRVTDEQITEAKKRLLNVQFSLESQSGEAEDPVFARPAKPKGKKQGVSPVSSTT